MNPVPRSSYTSAAQLKTLVEFLMANPDLAKGFSKTPSAKARAQAKWAQVTNRLNSIGGGAIRNDKKWIKYWSDKKAAVKKKAAARNAARRKTGGGVEDVPELSEVDKRIVALMGGESFATGDRHVQIHPFQDQEESPSILEECQETTDSIPVLIRTLPAQEDQSSQLSQPQLIDTPCMDTGLGHRNQSQILFSQISVPGTSRAHNLPSTASEVIPSTSRTPTIPSVDPPRSPRTPEAHQSPSASSRSQASRIVDVGTTTPRRRHRRTRVLPSPPSQRRTQFISVTEKFLRLEQQRLELDRRIERLMESSAERERLMAQALLALGDGMKALAEAINRHHS